MLSLLISPGDVVVTSCWYTCRPNRAQASSAGTSNVERASCTVHRFSEEGHSGVTVARGGDRDGNQYGPQRKHGTAVVLTSNRRIATGCLPRVHCLLHYSL